MDFAKYKKLSDITLKKVQYEKNKVIALTKYKNEFQMKRKLILLKMFFRTISYQLLYNKIQNNKQKLFKYINKQTGVQLFFIKIRIMKKNMKVEKKAEKRKVLRIMKFMNDVVRLITYKYVMIEFIYCR